MYKALSVACSHAHCTSPHKVPCTCSAITAAYLNHQITTSALLLCSIMDFAQGGGMEAAQLVVWIISNWQVLAGAAAALAVLQLAVYIIKKATAKPFLNPDEFKPLVLVEKTFLTHNTVRLRFALPKPSMRLGLPIGQHILFKDQDPTEPSKFVFRSYTPVSDNDQKGAVDFVIKLYPHGKMSQALSKLDVGGTMLMKGPKGQFVYKPNMVKHLGKRARTALSVARVGGAIGVYAWAKGGGKGATGKGGDGRGTGVGQ